MTSEFNLKLAFRVVNSLPSVGKFVWTYNLHFLPTSFGVISKRLMEKFLSRKLSLFHSHAESWHVDEKGNSDLTRIRIELSARKLWKLAFIKVTHKLSQTKGSKKLIQSGGYSNHLSSSFLIQMVRRHKNKEKCSCENVFRLLFVFIFQSLKLKLFEVEKDDSCI